MSKEFLNWVLHYKEIGFGRLRLMIGDITVYSIPTEVQINEEIRDIILMKELAKAK